MAKDDRQILRGVRITERIPVEGRKMGKLTSTTFTTGMEDELATKLNQQRLDVLVEQGSLAGTWTSLKPQPPPKTKSAGA